MHAWARSRGAFRLFSGGRRGPLSPPSSRLRRNAAPARHPPTASLVLSRRRSSGARWGRIRRSWKSTSILFVELRPAASSLKGVRLHGKGAVKQGLRVHDGGETSVSVTGAAAA